MKNKNKVFRIASLLLVLCFISTVMISGTFAKYTSEYSGKDTALVAKWDVVVEGGQGGNAGLVALTDEEEVTKRLDLFSHAFDVGINQKDESDENYIIAPGVDGEFTLSVTNNSDVAAEVTFEFKVEEDSAKVPMEFSLVSFDDDDFTADDICNDFDELAGGLKINAISEAPLTESPPTVTQTVYWRWPYEVGTDDDLTENDETDTGLGEDSAEGDTRTKYILKVTATATQIAPAIDNSGGGNQA